MPRNGLEMRDDPGRALVVVGQPPEAEMQIDDLKRALGEGASALVAGEQLCLRFGERSVIVERIGESVLLILDWPRRERDLPELLDHVIAMDDPAMHLFLLRGQTFIASVRLSLDVGDFDLLWAVVHA